MMTKQIETWSGYPAEWLDQMEFIVVDDHGSPAFEAQDNLPFKLSVYRVREDIPWNQMGARNLGQKLAAAPWRLMVDPDMVLPWKCARVALQRLPRMQAREWGKPWLSHMDPNDKRQDFGSPNVYFAHKNAFWGCGGYNEDFAGHKGYSDVVLHRTLAGLCQVRFWKDCWLDFYGPKEISDAETQGLSRDLAHNKKIFHAAVNFAARNSWKLYAQGIKNHVRFHWDRVR